MSLPLALGTTTETIPARIPYLSAQPDQIEKWRNQLGPRTRPRIGLAWAGRRVEPINRTRDMALASLHPLTRLDVDLISLQKEIPEQDMALLNTMPQISRLGESVSDFSDTAALIENLDLVISVDSAVTHLSGALGKPVWIMLRHSSEWRWFLKRTDSPWYPTARIFRQKAPGDWSGVVSDIVEQLQDLIVRHKQDSSGLGQVCTGESHEGDAPECRP
jgi:hypothetical protein